MINLRKTAAAMTVLGAAFVPLKLWAQSTRPTTQALIEQLNDDTWATRQAAQKELMKLGEAVRAPLQKALESTTSEETRTRAQAVLAALDENKLVGPSIITIHMKDAAPKDVYAELSRQCGAPLEPNDPSFWQRGISGRSISVDIDRMPFWDAFRQLGAQTGIALTRGSQQDYRLSNGSMVEGRYITDGLLQIAATNASYSRSVSYAGGSSRNSSFGISFNVMAEPRVYVYRASSAPELAEAVDDKGNDLILARNNQGSYYGRQGNFWSMNAQLKYPENPGTRITRIRGSIDYLLRMKYETLEIPDILTARNVTKTVGPFTLTVVEVKTLGDQYEMNVKLTTTAPDATNQLHPYLQELQLMDARGNAMSHQSSGSSGGADKLEGNVRFGRSGRSSKDNQPIGEPTKLVWEVATETRPMRATFEFTDLMMP